MSSDQTLSDIYNDGWVAFSSDQLMDNPFPFGCPEHEAWADGWATAERIRATHTWPWDLF